MRRCTVRSSDLDSSLALSPERYIISDEGYGEGTALQDLIEVVSKNISPSKANERKFLLADTAHAEHGVLKLSESDHHNLKSSKKLVEPGDVVISRLRPYLRQVAYVDSKLFENEFSVACSTEFYVLRSRDGDSIAYLVPWLLSQFVQNVLQASVEGAHHPRFSKETLLRLRMSDEVLASRHSVSTEVEKLSSMYHWQYSRMDELIRISDRLV